MMRKRTIENLSSQSSMSKIGPVGELNIKLFTHWARLLIWSLGLPKAPFMEFYTRIRHLWVTNGKTFTVLYTKECFRIVQHFISGNPILVTHEFPICLKGGLPAIIPGVLRLSMRGQDPLILRGVLSMLQVYRVINIPGKLKLETITDPFKGLCSTLPKYDIRSALGGMGIRSRFPLSPITLLTLVSAGPNHPVSFLGIWKDILAWRKNPSAFRNLGKFVSNFPEGRTFLGFLAQEMEYLYSTYTQSLIDRVFGDDLHLGRLSLKEEAAGKIRVFAITDCITQSVLKPLSDDIFSHLKNMPTDGTFDQGAPLDRLVLMHKDGTIPKGESFYSYDLSAATDRLPISLQTDVLSCIMGDEFSHQWRDLMVDRVWHLRKSKLVKEPLNLRYSVGQPMGAYSSWAMLALTHHVVVRVAGLMVGINNFDHYALLGDDIVIANKAVAQVYHTLMTRNLGVDINLSKSLISDHCFEYAKRLVSIRGEYTPVGAKNLLLGLKSERGLTSVLADLINKSVTHTEESVTKMFENIPAYSSSKRLQSVLWTIKGPFGFIPTADGLTSSMRLVNSLSAVRMNSLLDSIDQAIFETSLHSWESSLKTLIDLRVKVKIYSQPDKLLGLDLSNSPIWNWYASTLSEEFKKLITKRPVRKYVFDGPLVFTNFYREGWMKEMMSYIKRKLSLYDPITPPSDPFNTDDFVLPQPKFRHEEFFKIVRRVEKSKDLSRSA